MYKQLNVKTVQFQGTHFSIGTYFKFRTLVEQSYPSAKMRSVYSTVQDDWAIYVIN